MEDRKERYRVVDGVRYKQWDVTEAAVIDGAVDWTAEHTIISALPTKKLAETVVHRLHEAYRDGVQNGAMKATPGDGWCRECERIVGTLNDCLMTHKRYARVAYSGTGSLILIKCDGSGRMAGPIPTEVEGSE